ncbi:MAG: sulfite exporter TauE/SafE family protein [Clostridiales bacterium]|nr:sulfite exporter TauE/SafE family protein [Clostridiales bacterium]
MKGIFFILAGFFAGIAAGMGMGGGTLLIPALTLLLGVPQHAAQGVNVIAFLPAAAAALYVHAKAGRLRLRECLPIIAAGGVGALALSLLAGEVSAPWLRRLFGLFLIALALCRAFGKKIKK